MKVEITRNGQRDPLTFNRPILLLVEGGDDSALTEKIILSTFKESSSLWQIHEMGGNQTGWQSELEIILSLDEFDKAGRSIGLIMDADLDYSASLRRCEDVLRRNGLPTPSSSEKVASDKRWKTGIYLMPGQGRTGALENLVLDTLGSARVDLAKDYLLQVEKYRNSPFKNNFKSLVQAYLAGEQSVVKTLKNAIEKGIIADMSHTSLDEFREFLEELSAERNDTTI